MLVDFIKSPAVPEDRRTGTTGAQMCTRCSIYEGSSSDNSPLPTNDNIKETLSLGHRPLLSTIIMENDGEYIITSRDNEAKAESTASQPALTSASNTTLHIPAWRVLRMSHNRTTFWSGSVVLNPYYLSLAPPPDNVYTDVAHLHYQR
jgi:hypothetical protein